MIATALCVCVHGCVPLADGLRAGSIKCTDHHHKNTTQVPPRRRQYLPLHSAEEAGRAAHDAWKPSRARRALHPECHCGAILLGTVGQAVGRCECAVLSASLSLSLCEHPLLEPHALAIGRVSWLFAFGAVRCGGMGWDRYRDSVLCFVCCHPTDQGVRGTRAQRDGQPHPWRFPRGRKVVAGRCGLPACLPICVPVCLLASLPAGGD